MFKNLRIRTQLIIGFSSLILLIISINLTNIRKTQEAALLSDRIVSLRLPTAESSAQMKNGINKALADLRGWLLIGDEKFKFDRETSWKKEVYPALEKMQSLSSDWTNPENVIRLKMIETFVHNLYKYQKEIEALAHTPENIPAIKILLDEAIPKSKTASKVITEIINLEKNETASKERKALLGIMADIRGSFSLALANLRTYLLTGNKQYEDEFQEEWNSNNRHCRSLLIRQNILTKKQQELFKTFLLIKSDFLSLSGSVLRFRHGSDWNIAHHWLATKAAPIAEKLSLILDEMSKNQQELLKADGMKINSLNKTVIRLQWLFLIIGGIVAISFAFLITRNITSSLHKLVELSKNIARGDYKPTTEIETDTKLTEISRLETAMQRMGRQIFDTLQEVRESEAKINTILETALDAIITINEKGKIDSYNQAAEKMFGYTYNEVVGKNINMLMPEPYKSKHDDYLKYHLETGKTAVIGVGREVRGVRKNKEEFPLLLSVNKVNFLGRVLFSGILRDLTNEKSVQNQLIQSSKLASVGELATGVAHELNQPLSYIRGLAQLEIMNGKDEFDKDSVLDAFHDIVEGTQRMEEIINHLREFSRESYDVDFIQVNIENTIEKSLVLLKTQLKNRGIEIIKRIDENLPTIMGNSHQLEQVFINLLTNARDALEEEKSPEIIIEIIGSKNDVIVNIIDNGVGIPEKEKGRIFDPFFTTKDIGKGTGLGMSISYGIIKKHKGSINVGNKKGKGTIIEVILPS